MLDEKTIKLLDRVAEEWVIARKKLNDHDSKIKENDVEWIEAIKTIVVEANLWVRFIKKNEIKDSVKYTPSGGKPRKYTSKGGNVKITTDTKLNFGKYGGKDNDPDNPARSLNEIVELDDMSYIGWLSKGGAKNKQLRELAIEIFAKSENQNNNGGSEWGF